MSDVLYTRIARLQRLQNMRARILKISGSLEAAQADPRWDNLNTLISVISTRIASSLEPSNVTEPLSAAEIVFINFLLNNLHEL